MLHNVLDNMRIDGEYFWDGNETLVDAISDFEGSQELSAHETEDSSRRARIPMAKLETIINSVKQLSEIMLNQAKSVNAKSRADDLNVRSTTKDRRL